MNGSEKSLSNKINNLTNRELINFINICNYEFQSSISLKIEYRDEILNDIKRKGFGERVEALLDEIKFSLKEYIVPEYYFEWLYNDLRAQIFTIELINKIVNLAIDLRNSETRIERYGYIFPLKDSSINIDKSGFIMDDIYLLIDVFVSEYKFLGKKEIITIITYINKLWSKLSKISNLKLWIEQGDDVKINWIENYIKNKGIYIENIEGDFLLEQKKAICLASLDLIGIDKFIIDINNRKNSLSFYIDGLITNSIAIDRLNFEDRMKKTWNQKLYRDSGKERKRYHLPLAKTTKSRLEELAVLNNSTEAAVLDRLINLEYEKQEKFF